MKKSIGIDIGGTKVLGGVIDESGDILTTFRLDTPLEGGQALIETITRVARKLIQDHKVESVGVSAAGFISHDRTTILATPNIKNWNNFNLHIELSQRIDASIIIENDANAAAWGESRFGAGQGYTNLVMLTLGTGVGGGLIITDSLFRGSHGIGAEVGHFRLIPDGILCGCGIGGCFEQYASGAALLRYVREAAAANSELGNALLQHTGSTLENLSGAMVTAAAHAGDPIALSAFTKLADHLGAGIVTLCAVLDPELIVIGGGVSEAGELLLERTREVVSELLPFSSQRPMPKIVPARLGNNAGLVGVADLARRHMER